MPGNAVETLVFTFDAHTLRRANTTQHNIAQRRKRTSFLVTGFSSNTKCVNLPHLVNPSKSTNSLTLLLASITVVKFGTLSQILRSTPCILFLAHNSVFNRGDSGKFPRTVRSLSVKSMASWGPATPRFSIVGILWPVGCRGNGLVSISCACAFLLGEFLDLGSSVVTWGLRFVVRTSKV